MKEITITLSEAEAQVACKALYNLSIHTESPVEEEIADNVYIKIKREA